ncbi:GntR family transcriptional regulator [Microbacterium sp. X-17]|uniref:GntR family transcriptional regulator n=1 Tax=Microbacterium sp. X-17 TaxID=3144404 RepID=UPI0031F5BD52
MSARSDLSGVVLERDLTEKRITADYIADALRSAINAGAIEDGALLNQADLAVHFGVSRVPVREALRQLQAEGLVELRAHQLAVVTGLDINRLNEVYLLRAVLESWLLETAAENLTEAHFARARGINEQLRAELSHADWLELNAAFHNVLYEPSGYTMTLELLGQLRARGERYARMWRKGSGVHRPIQAADEHESIVSLVESGQVAEASDLLRQHVLRTRDSVLDLGARAASLS